MKDQYSYPYVGTRGASFKKMFVQSLSVQNCPKYQLVRILVPGTTCARCSQVPSCDYDMEVVDRYLSRHSVFYRKFVLYFIDRYLPNYSPTGEIYAQTQPHLYRNDYFVVFIS